MYWKPTHWLLKLVDIVDVLSNIPRVGWCQRDVTKSEAEDIAKHTLLVSYIGLVLCRLYRELCSQDVNCEKVLTMCLIHDVPEINIGNIAGHVRKQIQNFRAIEISELESILKDFPQSIKTNLGLTFLEYREVSTKESLLTVLSDKLATLLRAVKYYAEGRKRVKDLVDYYMSEVLTLTSRLDCDKFREVVESAVKSLLEFVH